MSDFRPFVGLRISTTPGAVPTSQQIGEGELAFNIADRKIFARFGEHVDDITDRYTQEEIDQVLSGKVDAAALSEVATSGSYNDLSDTPALGTAASQDSSAFDPSGTAVSAVATHGNAPDPHPQYVQKAPGMGLSETSYTQQEKTKLANVGSLANRNVYISDQPPDDAVGEDGDIWLQHWDT